MLKDLIYNTNPFGFEGGSGRQITVDIALTDGCSWQIHHPFFPWKIPFICSKVLENLGNNRYFSILSPHTKK
jgi:hypothetical protein